MVNKQNKAKKQEKQQEKQEKQQEKPNQEKPNKQANQKSGSSININKGLPNDIYPSHQGNITQDHLSNSLPNDTLNEYLNQIKYLQAELENAQKRMHREKLELISYGKIKVIEKLIPLIDSFDSLNEILTKTNISNAKTNTDNLKDNINDPEDNNLNLSHQQLNGSQQTEDAKPTNNEAIREGIMLIWKQLSKFFESEGLTQISAVGYPDPYLHEVLAKVDSDLKEGMIVKEVQRGYTIKDKVIRASKVLISNGKLKQAIPNNKINP